MPQVNCPEKGGAAGEAHHLSVQRALEPSARPHPAVYVPAADCQILYFSPSRRWQDFSPGQKGLAVRPNVTAYTLPPALLPLEEKHGPLFRRRYRQQGAFIARQADRNRLRDPLLWVTSPEHVHLLDHLRYDGLVYDCDRSGTSCPPTGRAGWPRRPTWCWPRLPPAGRPPVPLQRQHRPGPQRGEPPPVRPGQPPARPPAPGAGAPHRLGGDPLVRPGPVPPAVRRPGAARLDLPPPGRREKGNPLLPRLKKLPNVIVPGPAR